MRTRHRHSNSIFKFSKDNEMSSGQVDIGKSGTMIFTGTAIEAKSAHSLWVVMRMWQRGFTDRQIQGVTRKRALEIAGRITGKKYGAKDFDRATDELGDAWQRMLLAVKVVHSD
jgi:hypothetical protein